MADFLDTKVSEIEARLKELRPLVDEYQRLEAAKAALSGVKGASPAPVRNGRRRGRPPGSGSGTRSGTVTRRRRRRRGGATRSNQTLELVRTRPGITIPELADAMKIKPNYLYRILPSLQSDGLVRKEGKGWHPAG